MIYAVSWENAHLFGAVIPSLLRLRHKSFVERQKYKVPVYNGMEYDQYDTPAAIYLVWIDSFDNEVKAVSRLCPTDRPYMLKDLWPHIVTDANLPSSKFIWEGTRFAVDKDLEPQLRRSIIGQIVCAYLEFCVDHQIKEIIGVMPPLIWNYVFVRSGWTVEYTGEPVILDDGDKIVSGSLKVSLKALENVRKKMSIKNRMLHYLPIDDTKHLQVA